jgi:hypothetical protein
MDDAVIPRDHVIRYAFSVFDHEKLREHPHEKIAETISSKLP